MPAATPIFGFPYPVLGDPPHGPNQIEDLAEGVETAMVAMDGRVDAVEASYARGRIASDSSAATALSTAEAVVDIFIVTLVAGRRYQLTGSYVYGTVATNYFFRMRYQAGTHAGLGGTIFRRAAPNGAAAENLPITLVGDFVAPSSGTFTISVTCFLGAGAGSIPNDGANHTKYAILEDVGV